jgi:hypothetical protein
MCAASSIPDYIICIQTYKSRGITGLFSPFSFSRVENLHWVVLFIRLHLQKIKTIPMFWTLELASYLEEAPWPATKDELIDYSIRSGAPLEVVENLQELEDEGEVYESIEDIWPDYPSQEDFMFNEDEY